MSNVAYIEGRNSTHLCLWAQDKGTITPAGRWAYTQHPITLCGRPKRNFTSRAKIVYPLQDIAPRFPICKVCAVVVSELVTLQAEVE